MPQIQAAKKALRVNARRRAVNDRWRRKVRTLTREMKNALSKSDKPAAQTIFAKLQSALDRTSQRHIIHRNNASRQKARLSHAIAKLK